MDDHHWVPRSRGGRESSRLHRICHQKIHATLSEAALARHYHTPAQLQSHPEIARFIEWVRQRPSDYLDHSRRPGKRRYRS